MSDLDQFILSFGRGYLYAMTICGVATVLVLLFFAALWCWGRFRAWQHRRAARKYGNIPRELLERHAKIVGVASHGTDAELRERVLNAYRYPWGRRGR